MKEQIRAHIDALFAQAPKTRRTIELKEEMFQNTLDKYEDLRNEGYGEQDAYQNVVASIGDVTELFADLEEEIPQTILETDRKKKAMFKSIASGLYMLAVAVFFFMIFLSTALDMDLMLLGVALAGAICIAPTCLLVYSNTMYSSAERQGEYSISQYDQLVKSSRGRALRSSLSICLWTMVFVLYFVLGFSTGAWYITWVIFLIGICAQAIILINCKK